MTQQYKACVSRQHKTCDVTVSQYHTYIYLTTVGLFVGVRESGRKKGKSQMTFAFGGRMREKNHTNAHYQNPNTN